MAKARRKRKSEADVSQPTDEGKVEEIKESAATEMPEAEVTTQESPSHQGTFLQQCMRVPSFRKLGDVSPREKTAVGGGMANEQPMEEDCPIGEEVMPMY